MIDLGGIAKGYAVDRAVEVLQMQGINEASVNAGGDLRVFGERRWEVALRDADNMVRHGVSVRNCAIASSANLLNRRRYRGQLHSPHLGADRQPVLANGRVSVMAHSCAVADAMTKIVMADLELARPLLAKFDCHVLSDVPEVEPA